MLWLDLGRVGSGLQTLEATAHCNPPQSFIEVVWGADRPNCRGNPTFLCRNGLRGSKTCPRNSCPSRAGILPDLLLFSARL